MPADAMGGMSADMMSAMPADAMGGMDADMMSAMPADAMGGMSADMMSAMPADAMGGMDADMMSAMPADAMGGMDADMMSAMPADAMGGMDADMMSAAPPGVMDAAPADAMGFQTEAGGPGLTEAAANDPNFVAPTIGEPAANPGMDGGMDALGAAFGAQGVETMAAPDPMGTNPPPEWRMILWLIWLPLTQWEPTLLLEWMRWTVPWGQQWMQMKSVVDRLLKRPYQMLGPQLMQV